MRKLLAGLGVAGLVALGGGVAVADDSPDCSNFESPVVISNGYDPLNLDADGDGIGCESNPGEPVLTDLYSDLRGEDPAATESPQPELAHTGAWGPAQHPIRWTLGAGGLLLVGGAAYVISRNGGCGR